MRALGYRGKVPLTALGGHKNASGLHHLPPPPSRENSNLFTAERHTSPRKRAQQPRKGDAASMQALLLEGPVCKEVREDFWNNKITNTEPAPSFLFTLNSQERHPRVSLQGLMPGVDGTSFFQSGSFPLPMDPGLHPHLLFLAL